MDSVEPISYSCPKCNGGDDFCDFCLGRKKLNFVENIFGVKLEFSPIWGHNHRFYPPQIWLDEIDKMNKY